jgi:hypothetical protein
MDNIALNKPASASSTVAPFEAALAVDGVSNNTKNRWLATANIISGGGYDPVWLMIDLQANYWVGQYKMNFMGAADSTNWPPTQYSVTDFKLQSSTDGVNWIDRDSVTSNTVATITRAITPTMAKFLRVYITKGLGVSNGVSSILDFQAFEAANPPFLNALVSNAGSLSPAFSSRNFNYTVNVDSTTASITFTPTATNAAVMTIKVNGTAVISGQASQSISLNPGNNTITIEVATTNTAMKSTYTITVVRAAAASYLSNLTAQDDSDENVQLNPYPFVGSTLNYTASIDNSVAGIKVKPVLAGASITVNGSTVISGAWSPLITMNSGSNTVRIVVNGTATYVITVTKSA